MASNIWNIAATEGLGILNSTQQGRDTSLVFIGREKSGKTTLINQFMDRGEEPKHCVALDYTYARRTNKQMGKDVCSIWELGNGSSNLDLIQTIIKTPNVSVCIVVDLSQPQQMWDLLETVWSYTRKNTASEVAMGIIGAKSEFLDDMDVDKKNAILDVLHFWAGQFQSKLVVCSQRDGSSMKLAKDFISSLAFGTKFNPQPSNDTERSRNLERNSVKEKLLQYYPTEVNNADQKRNPGKDPNFADDAIDTVWRQKEEELQVDAARDKRKRDKTFK